MVLDTDHSVELHPRKLRGEQAPASINVTIRSVMRYVRMAKPRAVSVGPAPRPYLQRCAVQVRYTRAGSVGKWYSHGAYIAREARRKDETGARLGFDQERNDVPVAATLARWRKEHDELFFRVILSPESGDRLDLEKHTRDTMAAVERDLGTRLEWAAVIHRNTDNPHVHVVLRGRKENGSELRLSREYVKFGYREAAQEVATNQLGYQTEHDILAVQRREVGQMRWTGLDRELIQRSTLADDAFRLTVNPDDPALRGLRLATEVHLQSRLRTLERMGFARPEKSSWVIDANAEKSIRTMQKTHDRLKIMAEHGAMASDNRLPFRMLRPNQMEDLEGKVLVHGQDEYSGNNFLLLESITGEVVRVPHIREIAEQRKHGKLDAGRYVRIHRTSDSAFEVSDLSNAAALLEDHAFLKDHAERLAATIPDGFNGWLGDLRKAAVATATPEQTRDRKRTD